MKCEKCGKENSENARFCAECGKALNDTPIQLNLDELNIPAAARKARIVKVNAKKSTESVQTSAATATDTEKKSDDGPAPEQAGTSTAPEEANIASSAPESDEVPLIDLSTGKATVATETAAQESAQPAPVAPQAPAEAPLRIKNWIGIFILTAIPVVNLIMLLIWAISSKTNPNKKSYAQATLIFGAVVLVLCVAAFFVFAEFYSTDPVTSWNQFI